MCVCVCVCVCLKIKELKQWKSEKCDMGKLLVQNDKVGQCLVVSTRVWTEKECHNVMLQGAWKLLRKTWTTRKTYAAELQINSNTGGTVVGATGVVATC